ncbi:MAG: hypothetical protein R3E02_09270 [Blastomonas sp.]
MARILLGWELGAHQGHVSRLVQVADALAEDGHEVGLALQNTGFLPSDRLGAYELFQAPVWPRLLSSNTALPGPAVASMGDILVRLGLDQTETLPALVTGWHAVFAAFRPHIVIADFSPVMGLAARGRMPVLSVGTGFSCPPADLDFFPVLTDGEPLFDEAETLGRANAGLALIGEKPLSSLPEIFRADRQLVGSFAMFDPYFDYRTAALSTPAIADVRPVPAGPLGDEIFVYANERAMRYAPLWDGLAATNLPVRAHIPAASPGLISELDRRGIMFEPEKLDFATICKRSRFVLSHGGHGFVSSALLAALPQVVVHYDLEKAIIGKAIADAGVGGHIPLRDIKVEPFASSLRQLHAASGVHAKVSAMAKQLHAGLGPGVQQDILLALPELL